MDDPLAEYRLAKADAWKPGDVEGLAGELLMHQWPKGPRYAAVSRTKLYVEHEKDLLCVPRRKIAGVGVARMARLRWLRWGLGLYLLGMVFLLVHELLAFAAVMVGGYLVVKGFLSKALVVQLRDGRIPPILLPHPKWRAIGRALEKMEERPTKGQKGGR